MRQVRELSQEQMAEKLGLSLNGYSNIERGHVDMPLSRIQQIADVFDIDLMELFSFGEKNVLLLFGNENRNISNICHNTDASKDLAHELEKAHLEINYLKEIIELMKNKS
jgi:transcriptional regulator with XRE-family HTH domain